VSILRPKKLERVRCVLEEIGWEWGALVKAFGNSQPSNVHHDIIRGEIVENISLGLVSKCQVSRQRHQQASSHRYACRVMRNAREAVDSRLLKRTIDKK